MNDDDPAAAREKVVQVPAVRGIFDVSRLLLVEDEDIGVIELSLGGERFRTGCPRATLVQQRHPLFEEPRIIVRSRAVRLRARADEYSQRIRGGGRETGQRGEQDRNQENEASHSSCGL
jgi:hypothetical protein